MVGLFTFTFIKIDKGAKISCSELRAAEECLDEGVVISRAMLSSV